MIVMIINLDWFRWFKNQKFYDHGFKILMALNDNFNDADPWFWWY